jgi:hypothetical protein
MDLDPSYMFAAMGWRVRVEEIEAVTGGQQALLLPRRSGGFTAVVDPRPTPLERASHVPAQRLRRARLAHEFAHSFFYTGGSPPRRSAPPTPAEERFCDAFAEAIAGRAAIVRSA